jgi:hypothetical protein
MPTPSLTPSMTISKDVNDGVKKKIKFLKAEAGINYINIILSLTEKNYLEKKN